MVSSNFSLNIKTLNPTLILRVLTLRTVSLLHVFSFTVWASITRWRIITESHPGLRSSTSSLTFPPFSPLAPHAINYNIRHVFSRILMKEILTWQCLHKYTSINPGPEWLDSHPDTIFLSLIILVTKLQTVNTPALDVKHLRSEIFWKTLHCPAIGDFCLEVRDQ